MLLMAGCDTEISDNGHLDGFWVMQERQGITWSFQGDILELRDTKGEAQDIVMSFRHAGDLLTVSEPYFVERDSGDIRIETTAPLVPYGITGLEEQFKVIKLTGDRMTLEGENNSRLNFRKY